MGEPWFIAFDIAKSLEITNSRKALMSLNEYERNTVTLSYGNRENPNYAIVSESGFYKLISRSRKATQQGTFAYRFSNWVFGEVIPTIRKTGAYGVPWAFLNDHAKREKEYLVESSRRASTMEKISTRIDLIKKATCHSCPYSITKIN